MSEKLRISNIKKRKDFTTDEILNGIKAGDIKALSRGITLIESDLKEHQQQAHELIDACLPHSGNSIRIGITGVPGVGKSTFIEAFGAYLIEQGKKVAVLAIDPSSQESKGSILGDKTRMEELSTNKKAFIRPSASGKSLGGVAANTRESIILCEAAGFDIILIETVGVGQSETAVHSMTDFFLLLMLAGAGDELQGIKKGIMEMADMVVINKADGQNIPKSKEAQRNYKNALHLFPAKTSGWIPVVNTCSSLKKTGMEDILNAINSYVNKVTINSYFQDNRSNQAKYWLYENINNTLQQDFYGNDEISVKLKDFQQSVSKGTSSPYIAAQQLISLYKETKNE